MNGISIPLASSPGSGDLASIPPDNTDSLATTKDDVQLATVSKGKKLSTGGRAMTTAKSKRKPSKKDGTTDEPNMEQDHQKLQKLSSKL